MKTFGRYKLLRRIAAGGMAEVFLATGPNPIGAELVALKLIHAHIAEDQAFMAMFLDEARLTAPLSHPNLVQIFDLGIEEKRLYLAMEYIRGHPLHLVRQKAHSRGQGIGAARAAAIVKQAALGLHHAHEARGADGALLNLVHRDISPQNLLLDLDGAVKVVDFGVAKARGQLATSQKGGGLKGKAGYSAPEQLRSEPIDRRADIFALGAVLFELATGGPLFPGHNEAEILQKMLFEPLPNLRAVPDLPPALAVLITKAVAERPESRFPTALAFADALGDYVQPSGTGRTQLAQMMSQLYPAMPRTAAEAMADVAPPESTERNVHLPFAATPTRAEPLRPARPPEPEVPTAAGGAEEQTVAAAEIPPPVAEEESTQAVVPIRPRTGPRRSRPQIERTVPEAPPLESTREERRRSLGEILGDGDDEEDTTTTSESPNTKTATRPAPPPRRPGSSRRIVGGLLAIGVAVVVGGATYLALKPTPVPRTETIALSPKAPPELATKPVVPASALPAEPEPRPTPHEPEASDPDPVPATREPTPVPRHRANGTLTVVSAPWAHVKLDGRDIGVTPLYNRPVPAGAHRLELYNPEQRLRRVLTVTVRAHAESYEKVRLR